MNRFQFPRTWLSQQILLFYFTFFWLSDFGTVKLFQCNPNDARAQYRSIRLPRRPQKSSIPLCLPFGIVGVAINSVAFYHPLAGGHVNAMEGGTTEGFDICGGHADPTESYHYHKIPEKHLDPKERNSNLHAPEHNQCPKDLVVPTNPPFLFYFFLVI